MVVELFALWRGSEKYTSTTDYVHELLSFDS